MQLCHVIQKSLTMSPALYNKFVQEELTIDLVDQNGTLLGVGRTSLREIFKRQGQLGIGSEVKIRCV